MDLPLRGEMSAKLTDFAGVLYERIMHFAQNAQENLTKKCGKLTAKHDALDERPSKFSYYFVVTFNGVRRVYYLPDFLPDLFYRLSRSHPCERDFHYSFLLKNSRIFSRDSLYIFISSLCNNFAYSMFPVFKANSEALALSESPSSPTVRDVLLSEWTFIR